MSTFICMKCGCIDNTAMNNNYWVAQSNRLKIETGEELFVEFADEYYNTHECCSACCKDLRYDDGTFMQTQGWHGYFPQKFWEDYGRDKLLMMELQKQGDMVNASRFFDHIENIPEE